MHHDIVALSDVRGCVLEFLQREFQKGSFAGKLLAEFIWEQLEFLFVQLASSRKGDFAAARDHFTSLSLVRVAGAGHALLERRVGFVVPAGLQGQERDVVFSINIAAWGHFYYYNEVRCPELVQQREPGLPEFSKISFRLVALRRVRVVSGQCDF